MNRGHCGLAIALAVLAHLPALWGGRVWDDQVTLGRQLEALRDPADALRPPAGIPDWTYAYYRPLVTLSHMVEARLAGPDTTLLPHLTNLLAHAGATAAVWLLAARLLVAAPGAALFAAALFAVHPLQVEPVNWITGRSDVLATLFLLGSLLLSLRAREGGTPLALGGAPAFWLAALLSKETAIAGLVLAPLLLALAPRRAGAGGRGPLVALAAGHALALAAYLALRAAAGVAAGATPGLGAAEAALRVASAAAWYVGKALFPWPQTNLASWNMVPGAALTAFTLALAAAVTALAALAWRRGRGAAAFTGACWFWATLALPLWTAVGIVTRTPLAERHLYLPLVGFALVAGAAWQAAAAGRGRVAATGAALVLVAVLTLASARRGLEWQSDVALWQSAARQAPERGLAWLNLGLAEWRGGDATAALAALGRAAASGDAPRVRGRAHTLAGTILAGQGAPAAAEAEFRAAIALLPESAEAWYGLADLAATRSAERSRAGDAAAGVADADLALHFLRRALDRNPRYHPARLRLAGLLAADGQRLAEAGDAAGAATRYRAARDALDALDAGLAPDTRDAALAVLQREVGLDAAALRAALDRRLAPAP